MKLVIKHIRVDGAWMAGAADALVVLNLFLPLLRLLGPVHFPPPSKPASSAKGRKRVASQSYGVGR